jgi:hypothetical protein
MSTLPVADTPIATIMQAALNNGGSPPPKKEDREYRYYHCHQLTPSLKCKRVDGPNVLPTDNNTQLLFIKNYIPEKLDKMLLRIKWIPDRVIIEEK